MWICEKTRSASTANLIFLQPQRSRRSPFVRHHASTLLARSTRCGGVFRVVRAQTRIQSLLDLRGTALDGVAIPPSFPGGLGAGLLRGCGSSLVAADPAIIQANMKGECGKDTRAHAAPSVQTRPPTALANADSLRQIAKPQPTIAEATNVPTIRSSAVLRDRMLDHRWSRKAPLSRWRALNHSEYG